MVSGSCGLTSFQTQKWPPENVHSFWQPFLAKFFMHFYKWSLLLGVLAWKPLKLEHLIRMKEFSPARKRFLHPIIWTEQITPCEGAWNTVTEHDVRNCVHFCLRALVPLERCAASKVPAAYNWFKLFKLFLWKEEKHGTWKLCPNFWIALTWWHQLQFLLTKLRIFNFLWFGNQKALLPSRMLQVKTDVNCWNTPYLLSGKHSGGKQQDIYDPFTPYYFRFWPLSPKLEKRCKHPCQSLVAVNSFERKIFFA